jgi:hypothetical protein
MDENNPYCFISTDVIVWNGVISQYGSVQHFIGKGDEMHRASAEEVETYKKANV